MAAGGAVHRALEEWDLAADPKQELARQSALLPSYLAALLGDARTERAQRRAAALLERFAAGPLLPRLRALAEGIVARELPVLLPPGGGEKAPVGYVAGAIDLLYQDAATGAWVVADYKTDEVQGDEEIAARAAAYAPQGGDLRAGGAGGAGARRAAALRALVPGGGAGGGRRVSVGF
jgi:ATP-dependent exoDNAse (exonuclease V) beta subunit